MKVILSFFFLMGIQYSFAQAPAAKKPSGLLPPNLVSVGPAFAFGEFASTHTAGITIEYSRSRYIYGKNKTERPVLFTYALNSGLHYIFGKKVIISNYPYKYKPISWIYAMGGVMILPAPSLDINLTAGPALMLYSGSSDVGFSSKLEMNYFIGERIAISPSIQLLKTGGANAMWITGAKAGFSF